MGTIATIFLVVVGGFFALMLLMQVVVRMRARALTGTAVPDLPGALGTQVAKGKRALVYFFSPGCAACRTVTPQVESLRRKNSAVHLVDVSQSIETARALKVMATPSFVEIDAGKVVGYHVGVAPSGLLARYAA